MSTPKARVEWYQVAPEMGKVIYKKPAVSAAILVLPGYRDDAQRQSNYLWLGAGIGTNESSTEPEVAGAVTDSQCGSQFVHHVQ